MMKNMKSVELSREEIKGLLCCAFEGGTSYWCAVDGAEWPDGRPEATYADGGSSQGEDYWHWSQLLPIDGGAVKVVLLGDADKTYRLDGAAIARGSALLAERHPQHFADAINGNADATTGDAFIQLCLFGELIFG